jgi:hypothetical protein
LASRYAWPDFRQAGRQQLSRLLGLACLQGRARLLHRRQDSGHYRGPPMTLANMRAAGVRSLLVERELCHHDSDAIPLLWWVAS